MASVRSSSSRGGASSRGSSNRAYTSKPAGIHPGLIVGGAAIVVVALVVLFSDLGGGTPAPVPTPRVEPKTEPARPQPRPEESGTAKSGKPPKRPAPPIPAEALAASDEWFAQAKEKWNKASGLRAGGGESAAYQKALHESWDLMEKISQKLSPYTTWYEEADFEGWAMPAEYSVLQRRLSLYDPLRANLKRTKSLDK